MIDEKLRELIESKTPKVNFNVNHEYFRHNVINSLNGNDCIGIELGVAGGHFSKRMLDSGKFNHFYGVDLYEDHHNTKEYKGALKLIGLGNNYTLLRMSFDEAIDLFEDSYFDFIYFDGYAHTGEEGGKTFANWYKKLKVGGIFSGDDYHSDWPLVIWAVNELVTALGVPLNVSGKTETTHLNQYPSWFFTKTKELSVETNAELLRIGLMLREKTRRKDIPKNIRLTADQVLVLVRYIRDNHPSIASKLKDSLS